MSQPSLNLNANKKNYVVPAVASFVGMIAAVPLSFAILSAGKPVSAQTGQTGTTSQGTMAESGYALYAHAYTQGFLANAGGGGATAGVVADDADCDMPTTASVASVGGQGAVAATTTGSPTADGWEDNGQWGVGGQGSVDANDNDDDHMMSPDDWEQKIYNSYNDYSRVSHSSHSEINNNYTNSHNVVGSHNSTETEVTIEDSKDVTVKTDNETSGSNVAVNESFNEDSYNTETDTTIVNDSFNETSTENTVVVNESYNNDNDTTNTAIVNDSYNHETETKTETNNTTVINESYNQETETETNIETDIETDVDIDDSGNESVRIED